MLKLRNQNDAACDYFTNDRDSRALPGTTSDRLISILDHRHANGCSVAAHAWGRGRSAMYLIGVRIRKKCRRVQPLLCTLLRMYVLVVLLVLAVLPLDCLGFSWPRQSKETINEEVEASIPEGLSSLGGLDPSSLCIR